MKRINNIESQIKNCNHCWHRDHCPIYKLDPNSNGYCLGWKEVRKNETIKIKSSLSFTHHIINKLVRECHENAMKHGFWKSSQNIGEKLMLIVTELSEGMEAARNGNIKGKPASLAEELADACIRIFDLAGFLGIELDEEIIKKMEFNRTRPYLHNKQF